MPLSRRYTPEWQPGEKSVIGMDFSTVLPPGVGIVSASLFIATNTDQPQDASDDWSGRRDPGVAGFFDASIEGRTVYLQLSGGKNGVDYRFTWTVIDTDGNEIPRAGMLLCAATS